MSQKGTLTLSIEVELGWGFHDMDGGDQYFSPRRERETEYLDRLLALCDELQIPITFDVVGHLLLSDCNRSHGDGYPDGWFDADPGTNRDEDPLFYAPDLVEMIEEADVDHEICTHTFSHVLCDEVSDDVLRQELQHAEELHKRAGVGKPRSFVPPRHRPVSNGLLREHGIETIRVADFDEQHPENPIGEYVSKFTSIAPVSEPRVVDGVIETYCSPHPTLSASFLPTGQAPAHPAYRVIPSAVRQRIHERNLKESLRRAIEHSSFVHHWTHLHNMANEEQWDTIKSFLHLSSDFVYENACEIKIMENL
jgi:peptidoglycan/xylan/chitin deacetylase (PgdA/CDA1 family)